MSSSSSPSSKTPTASTALKKDVAPSPAASPAAARVIESADLSQLSRDELLDIAEGKVFVGLKGLPPDVTESDLINHDAIIVKPLRYLPFTVGRSTLYTTKELLENDQVAYKWYKEYHHNTYDKLMMSLHDGVILDLLLRNYSGRPQVGIMGGHALLRDDPIFLSIAKLCHALARNGYVIATGGGPGAMEAANLGAHMASHDISKLEAAVAVLAEVPSFASDPDNGQAKKVLMEFGEEPNVLSLGIPTFLYGHEPPNLFCKWQAKFFSNAIREDVLVLTCNCGIIYTPGSAGTRTEIAQFAVPQTYSKEIGSDFSKPMIFFGNFWTENTIYQTYMNIAQRERLSSLKPDLHYATKLYQTDHIDEIVQIVSAFHSRYYPYGDVTRGVAPRTKTLVPPNLKLPVQLRGRSPANDIERGKQAASVQAVNDWVLRDGMRIGIGSGTTVEFVIDQLAQLVQERQWKNIVCVPTSSSSRVMLKKYTDVLTVVDMLSEEHKLDIAIDGADEVDPALRLIKGGGGALLAEKVVAQAAYHYVVVADWRKESLQLGNTFTQGVPIEVQALAWKRVQQGIIDMLGLPASAVSLRLLMDSSSNQLHTPFVTDNGNYILDVKLTEAHFRDLRASLALLHEVAGVLAVGLFLDLVTVAYFGRADNSVAKRQRIVLNNELVSSARQQHTLDSVLDRVKQVPNAVVLMDLDLSSFIPFRRTIMSLVAAGKDYSIPELEYLSQESFSLLPGYTTEAWNEWINLPEVRSLQEKHPDLPWQAVEEHKFTEVGHQGATVHGSFHRRFWENPDELEDDVPVPGLVEFELAIKNAGGKLVFVSGRPGCPQRQTTLSLRRAGINPTIEFGDKKTMGEKIRTYGTPVAFFDDRPSNLRDWNELFPGIEVLCSIPGYTANPAVRDETQLAVSTLQIGQPIRTRAALRIARSSVASPSAFPFLHAEPGIRSPVGLNHLRVGTFNVENLFRRFRFKSANIDSDDFMISDLDFSVKDDFAKSLTAAAILGLNADVLALQEVESLEVLDIFNRTKLQSAYKYRILVAGNDPRGINVGLLSRYPFKAVHTNRCASRTSTVETDRQYSAQELGSDYIFSRDCLHVEVSIPGTTLDTLHLYINHFKSMAGGRARTRSRRVEQVQRVVALIEKNHGPDLANGNVIVCGDFNDYEQPDRDGDSSVLPLTKHAHLENVLNRLDPLDQWTFFWAKESRYNQLDYLLLSPSIAKLTEGTQPIIERRGQPYRATRYQGPRFDGVGQNQPKASDHCPFAIDIPLIPL